ncbi:hypothetical protein ACFVUH_25175 [Kitasatospora sp. NPDC058032]|uniref:hypothetical protein n=1 Tax=Kitasatospora sp. NPDC058032 TaxID=3346307 RepID=UPI0036D86C8B
MTKAFVKPLPDGTRRGNTQGLLRCRQDGWTLMGPHHYPVSHEPRAKNDPRPWSDGVRRFRALDCWAVGPIVTEMLAVFNDCE